MILLLAVPAALLGVWSLPVAVSGILALLPVYLIKQTTFGIPVTALEVLILGAAIGGAARIFSTRRPARLAGRVWVPVAALVAVWVAAAVFSLDLRAGLGAVKAWLVEPILLALLALSAPRTESARWTMFTGLLAGAVGLSLYGIAEKILGFGLPPDGRLNSVFIPANYHAMLTAPILALSLALVRRPDGRFRWLVVSAAAVIAVALLLTESYGGYLGVGVAGLVGIATLPIAQRRVGLVVIAGLALVAVASQVGTEKFHLLGKLGERSSSSVRIQIWHTAAALTRQHPLLGVGPNEFEGPYREEVAKLYWPPLEWLVAQPHSLYLAVLSETGVLGLAAFAWLLVAWWRSAVLTFAALGQRPWALAAVLALVAILAHGLVDTPVFKNDLSALFAFVLVVPFLGPNVTEARRT